MIIGRWNGWYVFLFTILSEQWTFKPLGPLKSPTQKKKFPFNPKPLIFHWNIPQTYQLPPKNKLKKAKLPLFYSSIHLVVRNSVLHRYTHCIHVFCIFTYIHPTKSTTLLKTNMSPEKSMVGVGIKQAFLFRNGPFFKWTFLSFLGCKYFGETIIPSTQPQTWLRPSWRASGTNSQRYYRKLMETHWCFNF